jgi:hypothetical protein
LGKDKLLGVWDLRGRGKVLARGGECLLVVVG